MDLPISSYLFKLLEEAEKAAKIQVAEDAADPQRTEPMASPRSSVASGPSFIRPVLSRAIITSSEKTLSLVGKMSSVMSVTD